MIVEFVEAFLRWWSFLPKVFFLSLLGLRRTIAIQSAHTMPRDALGPSYSTCNASVSDVGQAHLTSLTLRADQALFAEQVLSLYLMR